MIYVGIGTLKYVCAKRSMPEVWLIGDMRFDLVFQLFEHMYLNLTIPQLHTPNLQCGTVKTQLKWDEMRFFWSKMRSLLTHIKIYGILIRY